MLRYTRLMFLIFGAFSLNATNEAPAPDQVTALYTQALLAESFAGAQIENVLLGEPEMQGGEYRYSSEFTVREKGRTKHCEDWHFRLKKAQRTWYVSDIAKGRCSG